MKVANRHHIRWLPELLRGWKELPLPLIFPKTTQLPFRKDRDQFKSDILVSYSFFFQLFLFYFLLYLANRSLIEALQ